MTKSVVHSGNLQYSSHHDQRSLPEIGNRIPSPKWLPSYPAAQICMYFIIAHVMLQIRYGLPPWFYEITYQNLHTIDKCQIPSKLMWGWIPGWFKGRKKDKISRKKYGSQVMCSGTGFRNSWLFGSFYSAKLCSLEAPTHHCYRSTTTTCNTLSLNKTNKSSCKLFVAHNQNYSHQIHFSHRYIYIIYVSYSSIWKESSRIF